MKIKGGRSTKWTWEQQTNFMVRQTEWFIPLHFGGGDGENTVGELKDLLKLLPEEATFSVQENMSSGRETICVYQVERRQPTVQEQIDELQRREQAAQLIRDREAAREHVRAVQAKAKKRRDLLANIEAIDAAIHMVQSQALADGDPEARAIFQEELEELLAEKHHRQTDLSNL